MATIEVGETAYHIANKLEKHWGKNSLAYLKKSNSDRVYIVDGMERIGKSTWTFQQSGKIDEKMWSSKEEFLKRICFTPDEFFHAIRTIKNGVIIFDEAFRGFSSRSALSKVNKKLIQGLMEMGQNNNIVFIILPRIWLLDMYPAMLRSNGLFNLYQDKKSGKRVWQGFNHHDKNIIYQVGAKKGWKYVLPTWFKGNYYSKFPGGPEFEKAYLRKKAQALRDMDSESGEDPKALKLELQRDLSWIALYLEQGSFMKASKVLKNHNVDVSHVTLHKTFEKRKHLLPDGMDLPKLTKGLSGKAGEMLEKH